MTRSLRPFRQEEEVLHVLSTRPRLRVNSLAVAACGWAADSILF